MSALAPAREAEPLHDLAWWAAEAERAGTALPILIEQLARIARMTACDICGALPCPNPTFCSACRKADHRRHPDPKTEPLRRLLNHNVSLERAYYELGRDRAALSMLEAFTFSLRRGVDELSRPDTLRRLSGFDADQLKDVCRRVQAFKPEIAMLWSPEGVAALITAWEHCQ
jgi:hypothetical protein